jgi:hypothetical protein
MRRRKKTRCRCPRLFAEGRATSTATGAILRCSSSSAQGDAFVYFHAFSVYFGVS